MALLFCYICKSISCDLEQLVEIKQVSVEERASSSQVIIQGFATPTSKPSKINEFHGKSIVYFEFINSYKGEDLLHAWHTNNNR